jgi:sulfur-carrier protein
MITILFFGRIAQSFGGMQIQVSCPFDTDTLITNLTNSHPNLAHISYRIAVNQVIINDNTQLAAGDTVALMPAFSGG